MVAESRHVKTDLFGGEAKVMEAFSAKDLDSKLEFKLDAGLAKCDYDVKCAELIVAWSPWWTDLRFFHE